MELELIVGGTPPVITSNFDALKLAIQERLEPYKIQVTEENLAEAKKLATELGKGATQLNKLKTEKAKEFSAPIDDFKNKVMELVGMIQAGQDFLKKQVAVFEEKTCAVCLEAMTTSLKDGYLALGVRPEYQTGAAKISKMVGISKVTGRGELTKAAKDAVNLLAMADRGTQDRVDGRLAKLTAESLQAGLKSPLQREHVESFLFRPDDEYEIMFRSLIKIEVERQEKTLAAEKARMEREATEKAEKEAREKMRLENEAREKLDREAKEKAQKEAQEAAAKTPEPITPTEAPEIVPCPSPMISQNQKTKIVVVCQFAIETDKTSPEQIASTEEWFYRKFSEMKLPPCKIEIIKG